jgi:hypothetical protein
MSEDQGFIGEKQLLARLPISRRTLGSWKATGVLPYIKIGRRCLYDWASVQGALLRRQKGGQRFCAISNTGQGQPQARRFRFQKWKLPS